MTHDEISEKYPYLYETHMHTSEGSKCGSSIGRDMARAYKENGYTGVIVTDHNWGGNTAVDRSLPWEQWLDTFFSGYDHVKEEGDKIGLRVFRGYEAGHNAADFLIYGLTLEDMKAHPELWTADVPKQYEIIHKLGGMVIQAHPYREAFYIKEVITYEDYVDGIELINASHMKPEDEDGILHEFDKKAIRLASSRNLPGTAGSDQHSTEAFGGGVAFKTPLKDIHDYINRILNKEDYVIRNGRWWFSKEGEPLCPLNKRYR